LPHLQAPLDIFLIPVYEQEVPQLCSAFADAFRKGDRSLNIVRRVKRIMLGKTICGRQLVNL